MIISNTGDVTVTVLINLTSYTIEGSSGKAKISLLIMALLSCTCTCVYL